MHIRGWGIGDETAIESNARSGKRGTVAHSSRITGSFGPVWWMRKNSTHLGP